MKTRLILIVALAVSGGPRVHAESTEPGEPPAIRDRYRIDMSVDCGRAQYEARMALCYRNVSSNPLSVVRLRLDGNLGNKQSLEILSVEGEAGQALAWEYQPAQFGRVASERGAMDVNLAAPLSPGDDATLNIVFRGEGHFVGADMVVLQDDPFHSLDAWYPKAMTPRGETWSLDDDRLADYDVSLRLPEQWTVGSTGRATEDVSREGVRRLHLQAEATRGFTIYAAPNWLRFEKRYGEFELAICVQKEASDWADRIMDTTADAIKYYEAHYGPFPTKHLDIVCLGTMSGKADGSSASCNVITFFLSGQFDKQYWFLIPHEVAHQYFGSQIGFPRDSVGWVPVGLGLMMDEERQTASGHVAFIGKTMMRDFYLRAESMGFDTTLSQPVEGPLKSDPPWSFGWSMALMHGKAYAVCGMLRDLLGKERFRTVIRDIIAEHAGKIVTDADLIRECESVLGESLEWFVADWIDGRATLDYEIAAVRKSDGGWDVDVKRLGSGRFPVLVQVLTEDGKSLSQRVDRDAQASTLHFETASALKSTAIDPEGFYPDVNLSNNVWPRAGSQ
jgi:hypothetical protein